MWISVCLVQAVAEDYCLGCDHTVLIKYGACVFHAELGLLTPKENGLCEE